MTIAEISKTADATNKHYKILEPTITPGHFPLRVMKSPAAGQYVAVSRANVTSYKMPVPDVGKIAIDKNTLTISDLGWTVEEAKALRASFGSIAEDWDDPGMDIYDATY